MLPRIAKALIKSLLYFVFMYALPMALLSQVAEFAPELFARYEQFFSLFVAMVIFFVVSSELTAGTIYQYGFNVGKAIILIVFFVLALDGGFIELNFAMERMRMHIWADVRVYLAMFITIDLLGLAKSLLQAVNFLSERAEQQLPTPQPAR